MADATFEANQQLQRDQSVLEDGNMTDAMTDANQLQRDRIFLDDGNLTAALS